MENGKIKGRITVRIEDRNGFVRQECTVENAFTTSFLKAALCQALTGKIGTAVCAGVQYSAAAMTGDFGVYALNTLIEVDADTLFPPYFQDDFSLDPSVVLYNTNGDTTETESVMIPVNSHCFFSHDRHRSAYTFEFVKHSGICTVKSICVGGSTSASYTGLLFGEAAPPTIWTTGTANYFLQHEMKDGQQQTSVWKSVSSSSGFQANFVTKTVNKFSSTQASNLSANIAQANLVGGHVFTSPQGNYVVIKAVVGERTPENIAVNFYYNTDILGTNGVDLRTINIPVTLDEGDTLITDTWQPVIVSRPDNGTLEIFKSISVNENGVRHARITILDPTDPENSEITITDTMPQRIPYGIGFSGNTVGYYMSGFYFADQETPQETRSPCYYFPVSHNVNNGQIRTYYYNSTYNSGVYAKGDFTAFGARFPMKTASAEQFAAPVMTEKGILFCRVNSKTMYYAQVGHVVSGKNLSEPIIKNHNDVLRLIYEYSIS
jgi:hypothetical protein